MLKAHSLDKVVVGVCGSIGAGKTSLAAALGQLLNLEVYYEPNLNDEYLEEFYKDMEAQSFALQVHLLNLRFQQHQKIIWQFHGGIMDRTIYEDTVFARVARISRDSHEN